MINFIELKYHKNSKQEIVFENLEKVKENRDKVVLFLNGDLSPLFYLGYGIRYKIDSLFIPYLPKIDNLAKIDIMYRDGFGQPFAPHIVILDSCFESDDYFFKLGHKNILPKWNIPEDNAVLFLSDEDYSRYIEWIDFSKHAPELNNLFINLYPNVDGILDDMIGCKKVSLIIPELHAEDKSCQYHIENINKVCKELKEKYRVERIELFVSHCFLPKLWHNGVMENKFAFNKQSFTNSDSAIFYHNIYIDYRVLNDNLFKHIDKITTTNSTGILEVQKSDRLEVVDVITFFK